MFVFTLMQSRTHVDTVSVDDTKYVT